MNGLQGRKDQNAERQFPGCLGRMVNLFDLSTAPSGRRLLTDKPRNDGSSLSRTHQDGGMMPSPLHETEIEDKMIISESRRSSPHRNPNCTPMKMLIEQEMSKETKSEDGAPNLVAKLMGLDVLPSSQPSSVPLGNKLKGYSQHCQKPAETWMEEHAHLERQMRSKMCRLQRQSDCKDVYEVQKSPGPISVEGISTQKGRTADTTRDDKMAFVRQKFMEAKRLATDEKLLKSKEFQEAVNVLSSNKDVFLKLLEEPNAKLSKNLDELQSFCAPPESKRITILRPSKMVGKDRFSSTVGRNEQLVEEPEVVTEETPCTRSMPAVFSPNYIHQNLDHYVSQPTRIVVLKPSFGKPYDLNSMASPPMVSSNTLVGNDFIHGDEDSEARPSREVAREVTRHIRENILPQRRDESLLSSAVSNGYSGNCDSSFKKSDDFPVEDFSDPEVTSPASMHSWDFINRFDSPFSTSSLSHASYSPDSSVCREAKKRLSERWAIMASKGKCQEERSLRKSSSTLGEMLALSDSRILIQKQEDYEYKEQEPRISASCLKSSLSGEEFAESLKCLSRSKSMPVSSTLSSDQMNLGSIDPDSCQRDWKESVKDKNAKSFKGIVSSFFSSRNKKMQREKSSTFRLVNDSRSMATECLQSSAYNVDKIVKSSPLQGKNLKVEDSLSSCQHGVLTKTYPSSTDLRLNGRAVVEKLGPCASRSTLVSSSGNQDQPSPVSVLELVFEDDNSVNRESSGKELPVPSLRCNLIDKSPPIGSISRTLSVDYSMKTYHPSYSSKPSMIYSSTKEEQDLPAYIQRLLSSIALGTEDDPPSTDVSRWHSPNCPLDPTLRNKCATEEDERNEPLQEATKRLRRSNRKLVFDCVNADLLKNAGFGPGVCLMDMLHGKPEDWCIEGGPLIRANRIWGQIKGWFLSEVSALGRDDEDSDDMVVDGVVRKEVVGRGWFENFRLEMECIGREIETVVLEELFYEALVDLTGEVGGTN